MKLLALGIAIGLLIAFGGDVFARRELSRPAEVKANAVAAGKPTLSPAESAQLNEVIERVRRDYVDDVAHPALIDDALRGLVGGLDSYSSYLDAEEYADLRVSTAGTYAGIGIEVSTADRALRVVRPFHDSPAAAAGIRSGDLIAASRSAPISTLRWRACADRAAPS
jgi:carboxyl-terminal processing protease